MIVLATDYGCCSPYQAQLELAIQRYAEMSEQKSPQVISLFSDLPAFRPDLAAYLLPQYFHEFPADSVLLMVVDPGVGSDLREPLLIRYRQLWIVCAGDDLLRVFRSRAQDFRAWRILWQPPDLSKSFHGRDLFAPLATSIALGEWREDWFQSIDELAAKNGEKPWPEDYSAIVYIDAFGNAMTGIRATANNYDRSRCLRVGDTRLSYAEVFASVEHGACFYYVNAIGLLEIAANQASAADLLQLSLGQPLVIE